MAERSFLELLEQARSGSEEASRELYERYSHHILRVVRRHLHPRLRPKFDSLDFAQDVWASFFSAEHAEEKFDSPVALAEFLGQIARNKVALVFRHRLQREQHNINRENSLDGSAAYLVENLIGPEPTGSQVLQANEEYTELTTMRPAYQCRIVELLVEGKSHVEIAGRLGINEKTVQRLIRRLQREKKA